MKPYSKSIPNQILADAANFAAHARNPRKRNWIPPVPVSYIVQPGNTRDAPFHYKGQFKGWAGSDKFAIYTSRLDVHNKFQAQYHTANQTVNLRAPAKTEWDHDGSIVLSNDFGIEYHPTGEDCLAKDFTRRVQTGLAKSRERRELIRKTNLQQIRDLHRMDEIPFFVGLHDSLAVGNCVAGTQAFIHRHGFGKWALASDVLAAEPGNRFARLAVHHAFQRHQRLTRFGAEILYPHN